MKPEFDVIYESPDGKYKLVSTGKTKHLYAYRLDIFDNPFWAYVDKLESGTNMSDFVLGLVEEN